MLLGQCNQSWSPGSNAIALICSVLRMGKEKGKTCTNANAKTVTQP